MCLLATEKRMTIERNKCLYEIHWGRAQWLATDDRLTVRDLIEALLIAGKERQSIYIRTGDDAIGDASIQCHVEIMAEDTGTRAIL